LTLAIEVAHNLNELFKLQVKNEEAAADRASASSSYWAFAKNQEIIMGFLLSREKL
jgi:hypothetical protein